MLNYEIVGNGSQDLILLHGFMENLSIWDEILPHLSKEFRIIKVDLPGFGKSNVIAEIQTMEIMAEAVKEVADALALDRFHILGHSMGGYISLAFLEKYAERLRSITLFFSTYLEDNDEKKEIRRKGLRLIKENFKGFANAGIPNLFNPNEKEELVDKINLAKEVAYSSNVDGVLASQKGMIERPNRKNSLLDFNGKILIISGKHDSAINVTDTIDGLPNQKNIKSYLLDCGHNGHWEKPVICSAILNTELL